jgi:ATP-binding cassette subfamily B protein
MWNRQREAEEARERLARVAEESGEPNRNPPAAEEVPLPAAEADEEVQPVAPADAAE